MLSVAEGPCYKSQVNINQKMPTKYEPVNTINEILMILNTINYINALIIGNGYYLSLDS